VRVLILDAGEHLGATVLPGDNLLTDAGGDKRAVGSDDGGRFDHAVATTAMYVQYDDGDAQWEKDVVCHV